MALVTMGSLAACMVMMIVAYAGNLEGDDNKIVLSKKADSVPAASGGSHSQGRLGTSPVVIRCKGQRHLCPPRRTGRRPRNRRRKRNG